jgi:hypothetical protein
LSFFERIKYQEKGRVIGARPLDSHSHEEEENSQKLFQQLRAGRGRIKDLGLPVSRSILGCPLGRARKLH